jgi:hypothetical protein
MSELLLINPRRVKRRKSRKGRIPVGLRRYWASKRRGSASPKRRRRRARRAVAVIRRRRRRAVIGRVRRRRANPRHRSVRRYVARRVHHRRRHRNPRLLGGVMHTVVPAATGAVGGLVLDVVYGKLSPMLPSFLQTGLPAFAAKTGAAVLLGNFAGRFVGRERARVATIGAVTVMFYGMMKSYLATAVPSLGLSGFQDFVTYSGQPGMGAYMGSYNTPGFGAYMGSGRLGTLNPAAFINTRVPGSNMGSYNKPGFGAYSGQGDWYMGDGMNGM